MLYILALFVSIVLLGSASALYSCDISQTIMNSYSVSNSHAELYNGSLYSYNLCYNEVFGINYTLSNPHACSGSNTIVKLAQLTNSHVEGPSSSAFNIPVCYGDLVCTVRTGSCAANESLVLSMNQLTNSHFSLTNSEPYKLCCSSLFYLSSVNSTNVTNSTTPLVLGGFQIVSPLNGSTYNDFVTINITTGLANVINYSINSGTIVNYTNPITISLAAGFYNITVQASNNTDFVQQVIYFSMLNSTTNSGSGGTGTGGGSSGSGGSSSRGSAGNSITVQDKVSTSDINSEDPIYLAPENSANSSWIGNLIPILIVIIILIALLIIFLILRDQSNKK